MEYNLILKSRLLVGIFFLTQMMVQVSMVNGAGEHHEVPNHMIRDMENM